MTLALLELSLTDRDRNGLPVLETLVKCKIDGDWIERNPQPLKIPVEPYVPGDRGEIVKVVGLKVPIAGRAPS